MAIFIKEAQNNTDYNAAKQLMLEYMQTELGDDYSVGGAGLKEELEAFPGPYQPPSGLLLLAYVNYQPCGCLALRPISDTAGEVMRMYVQPSARGNGLAEMLMQNLIEKAQAAGYQELYLDSLNRFTAAHKLYQKLGFTCCEPYNPDTTETMRSTMVFMRLALAQALK